jgi:hypothetical protein
MCGITGLLVGCDVYIVYVRVGGVQGEGRVVPGDGARHALRCGECVGGFHLNYWFSH